jgi:hypothetical protein
MFWLLSVTERFLRSSFEIGSLPLLFKCKPCLVNCSLLVVTLISLTC